MPTEATKKAQSSELRNRLERAAEESASPIHPVYGWQDLKKTVSGLFRSPKTAKEDDETSQASKQ